MQEYMVRFITAADDAKIAEIIRKNLEKFHLDISGTAYYDPKLDHLSKFYCAALEKRAYFIVTDSEGTVLGGVGIAEFTDMEHCAEIQKLYLADAAKGKGLGKLLMQTAEEHARKLGYEKLYLETHTNLGVAISLYEKLGFELIAKPASVVHSTMNRFFLKRIGKISELEI